MIRKPIYEYRLNEDNVTENDVINYACDIVMSRLAFDYAHYGCDLEIDEAMNIIRENDETVEYLGV